MENNIDELISPVEPDRDKKRLPGPVASGILFSIVTVLLTFGGSILRFNNSYLKSAMGELLFILLPTVIFLIAGRYDIKNTLKLRNTTPLNYLLVVLIMLCGLPVVGILNGLTVLIIRMIFGRNLPVPQISIPDLPTLLVAILVIGLSAAVCEEIMFRGLILKGYRKYGVAVSLAVTSSLFGLLHRDIQKSVSTILLGALIGFIVYRTGSIFTGMVAHFTNNTVAVLLTFAASRMSGYMDGQGLEKAQNFDFSGIPMASVILAGIFYALMFMGLISGFVALLYALYRNTKKDVKANQKEMGITEFSKERMGAAAILSILPGLLIIAFMFLYQIAKLKWG
ncbi:MAG TPA: type II CAAX endopeptidase family protein [Ruminiclostridium sp.]|nr:type II CAAX endopeptidase family protein [Ruminiclostridium sp.]